MTSITRHSGGVNFALGLPSSKLPTFCAGRNPVELFNMQLLLSAMQDRCFCWIPACAGMTKF
jgi:hypothetical protein